MSYQLLGFTHSAPIGAAAIGYGVAVELDVDGTLILPTAGGSIVGVSIDKQTVAGQACGYQFSGIAEWVLGGTVAPKDFVKVDATGRAVKALLADLQAGLAVGRCVEGGTVGQLGSIFVMPQGNGLGAGQGFDDIVLGTTAPSKFTATTYVQTTGTKTGVLANGVAIGQSKRIVQSVAATTPIGTITGTFLTLAGAAATTLALGTAVGMIVDLVWTGVAWRADSAIGGTGASLS